MEAHPLHQVLTSMPGIGVRTCARILTEVVGKDFKTPDTWPPTPASRPSPAAPELKRALFLSAFAALHYPPSRAYYDRKRAEGKRHNQAIIALARRRSDVLFAMLRDSTLYQGPTPAPLASAA